MYPNMSNLKYIYIFVKDDTICYMYDATGESMLACLYMLDCALISKPSGVFRFNLSLEDLRLQ